MNNEHQILSTIEQNNDITQRDIAKHTGLSLGNVNLIIKRLIKKGLIKIERLSPKTIRYMLTPEGIRAKAQATYKYVVNSFKYINEITVKIEEMLNSSEFDGCSHVILYGSSDEIFSLLQKSIKGRGIKYLHIMSINKLKELYTIGEKNSKIIGWEPDKTEELYENGIPFINFINLI